MRVRPDIQSTITEQGAVLLDKKTGGTFVLNRLGAMVWTMLQNDRATDEIVGLVSQEYGVARTEVEKDVRRFINKLTSRALIDSR